MTLPRLVAMNARWEQVPPVSQTVACIAKALGWKPATKARGGSNGSAQELFEMLGGSGGFSTEKPEWLRKTTST